MIISRTPYRVSFFGGGSDYEAWFKDHDGAVISLAINRYCYLTVRWLPPFFRHKNRAVWSKIELTDGIDEIEHPAIRSCLQYMRLKDIEIHHAGDLPARSGMGTSASFTVGLLNVLHALCGEMVSKRQLAIEAMEVDQDMVRDSSGCQDHVAAAFGGFNRIEFREYRAGFSVTPIITDAVFEENLQDRLMLFFTGIFRDAKESASEQITAIQRKPENIEALLKIVDAAYEAIKDRNLRVIGELLHESWLVKRGIAESVTNEQINSIYERGLKAGAIGGKLLGAGAGGCILFYVEPDDQRSVLKELRDLIHVPFRIDRSGSQIIYYQAA